MTGEKNLEKLLASIAPKLMDGDYVFCSFASAQYGDYKKLEPLATCKESEGLTLLILKSHADAHGISYESVFKGITLTVHSSLDAVGLTAAISTKLTEHGISANMIAGYYHDHVFVNAEHADRAMAALGEFAV